MGVGDEVGLGDGGGRRVVPLAEAGGDSDSAP